MHHPLPGAVAAEGRGGLHLPLAHGGIGGYSVGVRASGKAVPWPGKPLPWAPDTVAHGVPSGGLKSGSLWVLAVVSNKN